MFWFVSDAFVDSLLSDEESPQRRAERLDASGGRRKLGRARSASCNFKTKFLAEAGLSDLGKHAQAISIHIVVASFLFFAS